MGMAADRPMSPDVIIHTFSGRSAAAQAPAAASSSADQAALQQFSLERLTAYGLHYADAVELRGRVTAGEAWQAVATDLAADCLAPAEVAVAPASPATQANRLYRASALLRMSQIMMLGDDDERREIFSRAADLHGQGAAITNDREKIVIESENGLLAGWLYPSQSGATAGCAVVIGGLEAWAMDFSDQGLALARRGIETLVVDGPGQGESRLAHRHYLTKSWVRSYQGAFDDLAARTGGAPMAVVGNSLGGAMALRLTSLDDRVLACCDNGGPKAIGRPPANVSYPPKIMGLCGEATQAEAAEILPTLSPMASDTSIRCPLLIVHGALDHLVSREDARSLFDWARSTDKKMIVYSDGDHCVYNHSDDKHNLISDWVLERLVTAKT
ncbi:MAG TPA: alpha/beta fold hydrolase [Caulobacteraceae bacterium]|jgi:esterase/lipase